MKKRMRVHWKQGEANPQSRSMWTRLMQGSLIGAFTAGIFLANLMGREAVSNAGILNDYFVEKFQYTEINGQNLFFYILGERVPILLLLLALAMTALGMAGGLLLLDWQGFSVGFMLSTAIAKYGMKGIFLVLGSLFPQYLFYFPVYILCCYLASYLRQRMRQDRIGNGSDRGYIYGAWLTAAVGILLIFLAGVFLESYVNPTILKKILKFF
ncbi:MAG: hypothetical protein HFH36_00095 [Lachnospiraceae bacterium]|nr:hypothetical protein [Lachnospiraceae bacterium]